MTAHTPGPWEAVELEGSEDVEATVAYQARATRKGSGPFFLVMCQKADGPADVAHTGNGPTSLANARLIAAAPEMLVALGGLLAALGDRQFKGAVLKTASAAARSAIAKATGGAP